jgi:hypothetical protein
VDSAKLFDRLIEIYKLPTSPSKNGKIRTIEFCIGIDARLNSRFRKDSTTAVGLKAVWFLPSCQSPRHMWKFCLFDGKENRGLLGRNCSNLLKFMTDLETKSNKFICYDGNEVELKFTLAADFSCLEHIYCKNFCMYCPCDQAASLTEDKRPQDEKAAYWEEIPVTSFFRIARKNVRICLLHAKKRYFSTLLGSLLSDAQSENFEQNCVYWSRWCNLNGLSCLQSALVNAETIEIPYGDAVDKFIRNPEIWKSLIKSICPKKRQAGVLRMWETSCNLFKILLSPNCNSKELEVARVAALKAFKSENTGLSTTHYQHMILFHCTELNELCANDGRSLYHYQQEGWELMNREDRRYISRCTNNGANVGRKRKHAESEPDGKMEVDDSTVDEEMEIDSEENVEATSEPDFLDMDMQETEPRAKGKRGWKKKAAKPKTVEQKAKERHQMVSNLATKFSVDETEVKSRLQFFEKDASTNKKMVVAAIEPLAEVLGLPTSVNRDPLIFSIIEKQLSDKKIAAEQKARLENQELMDQFLKKSPKVALFKEQLIRFATNDWNFLNKN